MPDASMNSLMTKRDEYPEVNSVAVSITDASVLLDEEDPEVDSEAASMTKAC